MNKSAKIALLVGGACVAGVGLYFLFGAVALTNGAASVKYGAGSSPPPPDGSSGGKPGGSAPAPGAGAAAVTGAGGQVVPPRPVTTSAGSTAPASGVVKLPFPNFRV